MLTITRRTYQAYFLYSYLFLKTKAEKQYICKEQEKATLKCSEKYCFNIYEILEKVSSQKLTTPTNYPNI